ncbi:MAG: hypothetical protein KJ732_07545, partial [Candidatus Margulisbacteria bacterium]|nr:hypothetical protein [Candidatus Margulisiibacteriota bacterium]
RSLAMLNKKDLLNKWDRIMMAITFAEAGEAETAKDLMNRKTTNHRPESRIEKKTGRRPELRV